MPPDISHQTLHEVATEPDQTMIDQEGQQISHVTVLEVDPTLIEKTAQSARKSLPLRRLGLITGGILLLATAAFLAMRPNAAAKPDKASRNGKDQITPVMVATVMRKTVPVQISAIGKVQAGETVSVTPQAGGRITGVFFKKGEEVKKGQLLFTLDDRSQAAAIQQSQGIVAKDQAAVQQARATLAKDLGQIEQARATLARDQGLVRQAQATLAKDEAQAKFAQAQSDRYNRLYKEGAVTLDQAQQYTANSGISAATLQADREAIANAQAVVRGDEVAIQNAEEVVKGDQAAIANAEAVVSADGGALSNTEVQSSYTKIYAPISGRAGNILITEGNVVQANSTSPLVVIQKIHPIQVAFSVPESNLPALQKHMDNGKLKVDVTFTGSSRPISGTLTFLNNTVDNTTGTIQLIGDFDNTDGKLFPGQFVNTTLTLTQDPNATVVPAQAVQNGPKGQFIFVVKPDNTVENVPVTASSTVDGLDVIQKGVQPGDKVVIDGQANLVTGSKIRIKDPNRKSTEANPTDANPVGNDVASPASSQNSPTSSKKHRSQKSSDGGNGSANSGGGNP
jgi:membrane fusion protein, multidrug efflux system